MNGTELSDSLAAAMLTSQVDVDTGVTWGLGIGLQDNELGRGAWHWGDNSGFKAYTITYPELGIGIVWFDNSENGQSILAAMLAATVGGAHPAVDWLDYDQYDSPTRRTRENLWSVIESEGVDAGISLYHELRGTTPPEAFDEDVLNRLGYQLLGADRTRTRAAPSCSYQVKVSCLSCGDRARAARRLVV
jgi:hypothetical protein